MGLRIYTKMNGVFHHVDLCLICVFFVALFIQYAFCLSLLLVGKLHLLFQNTQARLKTVKRQRNWFVLRNEFLSHEAVMLISLKFTSAFLSSFDRMVLELK